MTRFEIADEVDSSTQASASQIEQSHLRSKAPADQKAELKGSNVLPESTHELPVASRGDLLCRELPIILIG